MQRCTDSINPRTPEHANIIVQGDEGGFWYARIIAVFHINVRLASDAEFKRMDIIWVRWYGHDTAWEYGPSSMRLPRLGFIPHTQPAAFGFLDPADVVRAAHLIPAFHHGKTSFYLPPSEAARASIEKDEDYKYLYVNMYVSTFTSFFCTLMVYLIQICRSRHVHEASRRRRWSSIIRETKHIARH